MKLFKTLLLLIIIGSNFGYAQDTTILITHGMFDKQIELIPLSAKNGWLYKDGNDITWAKKDLDVTNWERLKPGELSEKHADKDGRVEGWFRIKIKIDSSFKDTSLAFTAGSWAASDLYVDQNLIASFGNTGQNGKPYKERSRQDIDFIPLKLIAGIEYTIALHVVDYISPFPPYSLKGSLYKRGRLLSIIGPKYYEQRVDSVKNNTRYTIFWLSVSFILSLLFWVLVIHNRKEKNLLNFALCSTFVAVSFFTHMLADAILDISFANLVIIKAIEGFFISLFIASMPIVIANIFNRKVFVILKLILILFVIIGSIIVFMPDRRIGNITRVSCFISIVGFNVYYLISSWKTLKGAQWAVVVGVMLTFIFFLPVVILAVLQMPFVISLELSLSGIALIFPTSLWIYVILRFKEIIIEMGESAQRVLQLSEHAKEQALNQQRILQEEVNRQTAEIRTTLNNLKSAQAQLIQSEKMASLGELTAGIAHEIQNPLNFVNNFSEVNKELLAEMNEEIGKGNYDEVIVISKDVIENQEKINHHGKRADAIVKGMLQHSRSSSGQKEPTDINVLADEYLRLAYHGLRAKDKTFNATMKTDFDESISNINIIPQDIGRVILNLIINAFYAVTEKKKQQPGDYEPTVLVSTKMVSPQPGGLRRAEIKVKDNGNGIPQKVLDKIFQPFFTTKPTGQGTGLGLSLSYDIIKAHGGELRVDTKEGEYAEFIISLPL